MAIRANSVAVIPLGGLGEIGKNMWVVETQDDIVIIDAGVMFPEEDMLGVDLVIPDISYLKERRSKVRGILLTHGHEDHIGALPYVLKEINVPVYGTRLTLGLVNNRLQEHALDDVRLVEVRAGDRVQIGGLTFELIHVNHSIADVVAIAIPTPAGHIVFATDFKFDQTPIDGRPADVQKLAELGKQGVLALFSDSTNAERPGYTLSEKVVGDSFMDVFRTAAGRILVATFASNVHRMQQVFDAAAAFNRKVCVIGRSMVNVVRIASELGYLRFPEGMLIDASELDRYPHDQLTILTTGSQGEPMSALSRMAAGEHRQVEIVPGDTVVISAHPIPGNERLVGKTINQLYKLGAEVIYYAFSGIHVSGHASQEELKWMLNLCRPRYFVPIHGEYRMLWHHARLAREIGVPEENIFILDLGDVLEFTAEGQATVTGRVSAGQVLVDGLGVGDVGTVVLRDRRQLSQDGILIAVVTIDKRTGAVVAGPDIVSRGFVYVRESEALLEEARERLLATLSERHGQPLTEWATVKNSMREVLSRFLYERTKRRPIILPVVMEV
ncbi:MAG: ribonuclease J [Firmicutes bacterium ZCTH02-B6]|nr:MAG: ribonuclease J [Firmicutes bacterium ZCTH02-B6]